jgi:UDP-N-acetyl-D-glucosamine dehydrogenase
MWMETKLLERIRERKAKISIIGIGYVGLPLAVAFAEAGFTVTGIDVDAKKVNAIRAGESYVLDIPAARIQSLVRALRLEATQDLEPLRTTDAVIICVPTPLGKTKDPDMSYIVNAVEEIAQRIHRQQLIVLESTTYPGTTEEIVLPRLRQTGLEVGKDFFLAFSPERIDPGRRDFTIANTPKVVGGVTRQCLETASALYGTIVGRVVPVSSPKAAEMTKLLENTFRAVNIGLVNEVAIMCDRLGIDTYEVIDAAATKPFGFMSFQPGPGLGGHCLPIDPRYLAWKLNTLNYRARFIEVAEDINFGMPAYVVNKVTRALNERGKPVKGSRVLVLGIAYKRDVSDVRESPAFDVINLLGEMGAVVTFHDPYIPELHWNGMILQSESDLATALPATDCVVILTDHSSYDWQQIISQSNLIVDTRNVLPRTDTGGKVIRL